jgi:hypothetical protein
MDVIKEIAQCEEKLMQAIHDSDLGALDELLHENLLFNLPDGQTKGKAFDLETYRSGQMKVSRISAIDRTISPIDETVAVVAVTIDLNAVYYGQPIDGKFRYLRVWKSSGGKWQVIGGSVVPVSGLPQPG